MFTAESLRGGEDPAALLRLQLQIKHPENVLLEENVGKVQKSMHRLGDKEADNAIVL